MNLTKKTCQLYYSKKKKLLLAQTTVSGHLGFFHVHCGVYGLLGCCGGWMCCGGVVVVHGHVEVAVDMCGGGGGDGGVVSSCRGG